MATTLLPATSAALDLAEEDGEREVPGRDAHPGAAAAHPQHVALAGRAGKLDRLQSLARLGGIIAAEVDRLAHLGEGVGDRLPRLLDADPHQRVALALEQVGEPLEAVGALVDASGVPGGEGGEGAGDHGVGLGLALG